MPTQYEFFGPGGRCSLIDVWVDAETRGHTRTDERGCSGFRRTACCCCDYDEGVYRKGCRSITHHPIESVSKLWAISYGSCIVYGSCRSHKATIRFTQLRLVLQ